MNSPVLTDLFSGVVALSWRAGWLILLLAVLRRAVRGRVPAQVWFVAWILVALRLLLPFSIPASWSPYNLSPAQAAAPAPQPIAPAVTTVEFVVPRPTPSVSPAPVLREKSRPSWSRTEIFAALWLAGIGGLAVARVFGAWSFRRQLRSARPAADARIVSLVKQEAARVLVLETDAVDAPALFGFVRPRLLLPPGLTAKLSDDELRHVVRHELGHWRRRDLIAQALMQAAVALHWFNPLAWFAARLARADCELACDEFVLRRESAAGASAYGATLLKVLGVVRGRRRPIAVVAMLEGREQLTQRIRMIAGYRASTLGRVLAGIALVGVLAAISFTRESRAEETRRPTAPPSRTIAAAAEKPVGVAAIGDGKLTVTAGSSVDALTQARVKVDQLERQLQDYRERNNLFSLDQRRDLAHETIRALTFEAARASQNLQLVQSRLGQVSDYRARKADLTNLPFIASQAVVVQLKQRLSELKITRASLVERYLEKHPRVVSVTNTIAATEEEMREAVETVCAQLEAEAQSAQKQSAQLSADLDRKKAELIDLERLATDYGKLQRELRVHEELLAELETRAKGLGPSVAAPGLSAAVRTPSGDFTVSVMGAVNQQGGIRFSADDKPILLDAIARAGGFGPFADRDAVRVIRLNSDDSRTTYTVREQALMAGRDELGVLQRGDIVVVPDKPAPPARNHVNVVGQVNQPGEVQFPSNGNMTLIDAISRVGGPTRLANLKKVILKRISPDGTVQVETINVEEMMKGESRETWPLQPGDTITVPERTL